MKGDREYLKKVADQIVSSLKEHSTSGGWKTTQNDPLKIQEKQIDERVIVKAETILNLPFQKVVSFFQDFSFMNKVSEGTVKIQVLLEDKEVRVFHMLIQLPNPMSNREVVAVNTLRVEGSRAFCGNRSCNYPFTKKDLNSVIAEFFVVGYMIEKVDQSRTRVVNVSDADVKGSIPKFILNSSASKRVQNLWQLENKILAK